jgi:hypothetical protein
MLHPGVCRRIPYKVHHMGGVTHTAVAIDEEARGPARVAHHALRAGRRRHFTPAARRSTRRRRRVRAPPTGSRSAVPTAALPGGRVTLRICTSPHLRDSRAAAPTAALQRWPPEAANCHWHVHLPQGQPCWCAHCSTARWPPLPAYMVVMTSHGQPVLPSPLQHCQVFRCVLQRCTSTPPTGQPCCRAHCSTVRWPPAAAELHIFQHRTEAVPKLKLPRCHGACCPVAIGSKHTHTTVQRACARRGQDVSL